MNRWSEKECAHEMRLFEMFTAMVHRNQPPPLENQHWKTNIVQHLEVPLHLFMLIYKMLVEAIATVHHSTFVEKPFVVVEIVFYAFTYCTLI